MPRQSDATADTTTADSGKRRCAYWRVGVPYIYGPNPMIPTARFTVADNNEFAYGYDLMMAKICEGNYDPPESYVWTGSSIQAVTTRSRLTVLSPGLIPYYFWSVFQAVDFTGILLYMSLPLWRGEEGSQTCAQCQSGVADLLGTYFPAESTCNLQHLSPQIQDAMSWQPLTFDMLMSLKHDQVHSWFVQASLQGKALSSISLISKMIEFALAAMLLVGSQVTDRGISNI